KKLWGYPELLFQWEWQLGKILKAQWQKARGQAEQQEAIRAYGRAAGHLETARKNYAGTTPTFSKDGENFYLERAELLLEAAKSARGEDKQNLLKTAIDSIESRQEAGLRNYFQDECVTEKSQGGEKRLLQNNEVLVYMVMFGNRVELIWKFSSDNDPIQQETSKCDSCKDQSLDEKIGNFRKEIAKETWRSDGSSGKLYNNLSRLFITESFQETLINHRNKIDTVIIVPSNELLRVPFASLSVGKKLNFNGDKPYFIYHYAISEPINWKLSGTSLNNGIDLEQDPALLAGLAIEPQMSEEACLQQQSKSVEIVPGDSRSVCTKPLCYVGKEIEEIGKVIKNRTTLLGKNFTVGKVRNVFENNNYSIVHFSTHGYFDQYSRNDSWLCTHNRDETLTLDKLEELLQGKKVKLLTLSACETALGAELGLAGISVKVGTQSALGSLWSVDDKSTSELMRSFYNYLTGENSMARALQKAQLDLLKRDNFKTPYYWAGFLLIGNWQNN
ncbi:MAG: hypothetical protein BWK78_04965, partial [Thiotrichaceae bacterium IS1]